MFKWQEEASGKERLQGAFGEGTQRQSRQDRSLSISSHTSAPALFLRGREKSPALGTFPLPPSQPDKLFSGSKGNYFKTPHPDNNSVEMETCGTICLLESAPDLVSS